MTKISNEIKTKKIIRKKNNKKGKKSKKVRLINNNVHTLLNNGDSAKGGGLGSSCGTGSGEMKCWKLMVYYNLNMENFTKQEHQLVKKKTFEELQKRDPDVNFNTLIEDRIIPNDIDYGETSIVELEFDGAAEGGKFNSQKLDSLVSSISSNPLIVTLEAPNNVHKSISVRKELGFKTKPMDHVGVAIDLAGVPEQYKRRVPRTIKESISKVLNTSKRWRRGVIDEKRLNLIVEKPRIQDVSLLDDMSITKSCSAKDPDNNDHIKKCSTLKAQECGACEDTSPYKNDEVCDKAESFRQKGSGTGEAGAGWGTYYEIDPDCEWKKCQQDGISYGPRKTDMGFPAKPNTIGNPDKNIIGTADEMESYIPNPAPMNLCGPDGCIDPLPPLVITFPGNFSSLTSEQIEELTIELKSSILGLGGFSTWTDDKAEIIEDIQWSEGSIIATVFFTRAASNYGIDQTNDLVDLINKSPINIKSGTMTLQSNKVGFSGDTSPGSGSGSGTKTGQQGGVKFSLVGGDFRYNRGSYKYKTRKSNTKFKKYKKYKIDYLF